MGCSVAFCELYLYTCMERGHIKGFMILLQLGSSDRVQGSLQFFALGFKICVFQWNLICINVDAFLIPFGHLLDAFWTLFG